MALSTAEAEYMAINSTANEVEFIKNLVKELSMKEFASCPVIFADNIAAIKLSVNTGYSPRTKHIDVRHHRIRELVNKGEVKLEHVRSEENTADLMTKGLNRVKHSGLVKRLYIP